MGSLMVLVLLSWASHSEKLRIRRRNKLSVVESEEKVESEEYPKGEGLAP
jgi:hypothetical protein